MTRFFEGAAFFYTINADNELMILPYKMYVSDEMFTMGRVSRVARTTDERPWITPRRGRPDARP